MQAVTSEDLIRDPIGNFPAATVACFDPTRGDLPRRALDETRCVRYLQRLGQAGAPKIDIARDHMASGYRTHARTSSANATAATASRIIPRWPRGKT